ncbi:hypothetical protein C8Q76DRAFT_88391 [Earliella scabrosa]|nr:hypothetical protein C8Q76DRAFT_88391 [Earliella scabrosa]
MRIVGRQQSAVPRSASPLDARTRRKCASWGDGSDAQGRVGAVGCFPHASNSQNPRTAARDAAPGDNLFQTKSIIPTCASYFIPLRCTWSRKPSHVSARTRNNMYHLAPTFVIQNNPDLLPSLSASPDAAPRPCLVMPWSCYARCLHGNWTGSIKRLCRAGSTPSFEGLSRGPFSSSAPAPEVEAPRWLPTTCHGADSSRRILGLFSIQPCSAQTSAARVRFDRAHAHAQWHMFCASVALQKALRMVEENAAGPRSFRHITDTQSLLLQFNI